MPALVWIGAVIALLAVWSHDIRGLYLAGACILIGTLQAAPGRIRPGRISRARPALPMHAGLGS